MGAFTVTVPTSVLAISADSSAQWAAWEAPSSTPSPGIAVVGPVKDFFREVISSLILVEWDKMVT